MAKKKLDIPQRTEEDRRARQASRMAGILGILERLLQRSKWNVKSLADDLELSQRTVHRYLDVLEMVGVPFYYDRDERCYRVRPGYQFPVMNLTPDELLGQATATVLSEAVGLGDESTARPTTRKVAARSREETRDLLADAESVLAVLDLRLATNTQHQELIKRVQWALIEKKQLVGEYESPHEDGPVQLTLHPYRLCLSSRAWYLIARSEGQQQPWTFRIARFKSLRMIDSPSDVPKEFDLQAYFGNAWSVYRGEKTYDIEIEFSKEVSDQVTETVWHHTQTVKRHKDGRVTLTFKVDGLNEILRWVLGWAGRCKVVRPDELRTMVTEQLRAALELHGNPEI